MSSGLRVVSQRKDKKDGYCTEGTTTVFSKEGGFFKRRTVLATFPAFIGRHRRHVDPSGKIMVLCGNIFFTSIMKSSGDVMLADIFALSDGSVKRTSIQFSTVFGHPVEYFVQNFKVEEMGGGWIKEIGQESVVDWKSRTITFSVADGRFGLSDVTVSF